MRFLFDKIYFFMICFVFQAAVLFAQNEFEKDWRAYIVRKDSNTVDFNFYYSEENGQPVFYIANAEEKIRISPVTITTDSVIFSMPVFESSFRAKRNSDGSLHGTWSKGTAGETQHWQFFAFPGQTYRFLKTGGNARQNISGRWDVTITRADGSTRKAVAEFKQQGDMLVGTFLTPTGDYRYLEGIVTGDSLKLSTFDGAHAYSFRAKIDNAERISGGVFYAGFAGKETWKATRNETVKDPEQIEPTRLRKGKEKLNFTFNDLEGKRVSLNDKRYDGKVVIVQIMGSWCPNCMDETKFLSDYYNNKRDKGVEIIALAYEYSTDLERSRKSLYKFQKLFNVQYPMLITGVTSSDEYKTEKTLPQLTPIRSFPTTIFLDKKKRVRKIHGVFYGPGTGEHFEEYKKEFFDTIDRLLKEN